MPDYAQGTQGYDKAEGYEGEEEQILAIVVRGTRRDLAILTEQVYFHPRLWLLYSTSVSLSENVFLRVVREPREPGDTRNTRGAKRW